MTRTNKIDEHHAAMRGRDFKITGERMIGRLTASEFDMLDAIAANMRIGIDPLPVSIGRTLRLGEDAVLRRLYSYRRLGLIETRMVDLTVVNGGKVVEVNAYVPTDRGTYLFAEALSLMDRGLVAA